MKASELRRPVPRWWMRQCSAMAAVRDQLQDADAPQPRRQRTWTQLAALWQRIYRAERAADRQSVTTFDQNEQAKQLRRRERYFRLRTLVEGMRKEATP